MYYSFYIMYESSRSLTPRRPQGRRRLQQPRLPWRPSCALLSVVPQLALTRGITTGVSRHARRSPPTPPPHTQRPSHTTDSSLQVPPQPMCHTPHTHLTLTQSHSPDDPLCLWLLLNSCHRLKRIRRALIIARQQTAPQEPRVRTYRGGRSLNDDLSLTSSLSLTYPWRVLALKRGAWLLTGICVRTRPSDIPSLLDTPSMLLLRGVTTQRCRPGQFTLRVGRETNRAEVTRRRCSQCPNESGAGLS